MKTIVAIMAGTLLTLGLTLALSGCDGQPPVDEPEAAAETVRDAVENQQYCPVMEGMDINRAIYADHDGQRVYFCCAGCVATFEQNPEMYLEKVKAMHADDENDGHHHEEHHGVDHDH